MGSWIQISMLQNKIASLPHTEHLQILLGKNGFVLQVLSVSL